MSKTRQRRLSAYQTGYDDGLKYGECPYQFGPLRSPHMSFYKAGLRRGVQDYDRLKPPELEEMSFWQRVLYVFGRRC